MPILSVADFQKWLYMRGVGHEVKLTFLRGGKPFDHRHEIEERPGWTVPPVRGGPVGAA